MSDNDTLRQAIAEEESRLARIEKERAETLAKLQQLKERLEGKNSSILSKKPTLSGKIHSFSEIPFEVDLVDKSAYSTGRKKPRRI